MTALVIANTQIRCDAAGRYCLNDLHQASGAAKRNQPANWLRLDQTRELIAECAKSDVGLLTSEEAPVNTVNDGFGNGTYAIKELVYAYAMWISAAFHLHVIRAYDALVTARQAEAAPPGLLAFPQYRADQLVSAGRIFAAALRTARHLRLPPSRAMRAAFDCTLRHTGIDWAEELEAADMLRADAPPDELAGGIAAWLQGRDCVTSREVIAGTALGEPESVALQMRVADAMRALGWVKVRDSETRAWQWRAPRVSPPAAGSCAC